MGLFMSLGETLVKHSNEVLVTIELLIPDYIQR